MEVDWATLHKLILSDTTRRSRGGRRPACSGHFPERVPPEKKLIARKVTTAVVLILLWVLVRSYHRRRHEPRSPFSPKNPSSYGPTVGLVAWQATEDSLKALCVGHSIPYSHEPEKIMAHIKNSNLLNQKDFDQLAASVQSVSVSGNYNDIRYPGQDPKIWDDMPQDQRIVRASAAKKTYQICLDNLATSGITA